MNPLREATNHEVNKVFEDVEMASPWKWIDVEMVNQSIKNAGDGWGPKEKVVVFNELDPRVP